MEKIELQWNQATVDKIHSKHGVTPEEVVYEGKPLFKKGPVSGKDRRYYVLGQTGAGRHLFIVLQKIRGTQFSVITSRNMEDDEKKLYKKHSN